MIGAKDQAIRNALVRVSEGLAPFSETDGGKGSASPIGVHPIPSPDRSFDLRRSLGPSLAREAQPLGMIGTLARLVRTQFCPPVWRPRRVPMTVGRCGSMDLERRVPLR